MAAELSLLPLNQHQKLAQQQQQLMNPGKWSWPVRSGLAEDDDSWVVRAFAEDTSSAMGATWPPRSYMCTFCRREFRSAQALGGHMNVHRRDRARLRQSLQGSDFSPSTSPSPSPPIIFPPPVPEFVASTGGYCLLYPIPNAGRVFAPAGDSPSTILSISTPYPGNGLVSPCPLTLHSGAGKDGGILDGSAPVEELDLELRLGW